MNANSRPMSPRPLVAAWLTVVVFLFPALASAQSFEQVTVRGLNITLSDDWADNPGYRPLRVTITPVQPAPVDRNLTVVAEAQIGWRNPGRATVEEDILVPAGASVVRRFVARPYTAYANECGIVLLEDGERLKTNRPITLRGSQRPFTASNQLPKILFVGDQTPDTTALGQYYGAAAGYRYGSGPYSHGAPGSQIAVPKLPSAMPLSPADLPARWIDYSCFDIACLSLDQLRELREQHPDAARALVAWARAGGTLWVFGTGDDARRAELDALLTERSSGSNQPTQSPWKKPARTDFGKCPSWISWKGKQSVEVWGLQYDDPAEIKTLWAWSKKPPAPPKNATFRFHDLGFGRVVAIDADQPFPGDPWQWGWIVESMDHRADWSKRYGISYTDSNPDFWNFLVSGVGLAPVTQFQVLISLFVLVIGPVNYMLLRRRKRLHLLILTIPAGALAVTGLLFGYALIADGLSIRVRARSVTRIDQRAGQAVCWARLSYYAGLSPRGGLRFSDDVAVLPYEADEDAANTAQRRVVWAGDQRLTQGWLPSRTPTQYFTVRSRATDRGVRITPAQGQGAGLKIENRLGAPVKMLALRAHDGNYFWATDLAAGASAAAQPAKETAVVDALARALQENAPALPPGVSQPPGSSAGFGPFLLGRWRRGYWNRSTVSPADSLMETSLAGACTVGGIAPGQYVAIVSVQPELELGTPSAEEEGSFHVVLGEW